MKKFILCLLMSIPSILMAQKIYVWCPDTFEIKPRTGMMENDTINVVIFDGRAIPKQKKIECTSDQFIQNLFSQFRKAYPSAILNLLPENDYHKKHNINKSVLIKVGISAYQAGFGTDVSIGMGFVNGHISTIVFPKGQWNALTAYSVQIFLGTTNESKDISNLASRPNILGYSSAKKALNETYNKSNQELFFFIDKQLTN